MPHIHAILEENEKIVQALTECKTRIRKTVSAEFPKYLINDIVVIPKIISVKEMAMADNMMPLELVIDLGKLDKVLDDSDSDAFRDRLLEFCPELKDINFGVWLKATDSNGFSEHKPG